MRFHPVFPYAIVVLLSTLLATCAEQGRFNIIKTSQSEEDKWVHYSSRILKIDDGNGNTINLDDTNQFTDSHLVGAAFEAWKEMDRIAMSKKTRPTVMVAMQVKGELFFSSSIKNNNHGFMLQFPASPVSVMLDRCSISTMQEQSDDEANEKPQGHKNNGNCGEPAATHLFYRSHPDEPSPSPGQDILPLPQGARIVAVALQRKSNDLEIKDPCGSGDGPEWGCDRFVRSLGLRAVSSDTAAEDVPADWRIE